MVALREPLTFRGAHTSGGAAGGMRLTSVLINRYFPLGESYVNRKINNPVI